MERKLRIGTRGSPLALIQAQAVASALKQKHNVDHELVIIKTSGDQTLKPLAKIGGKGLFVKEIDYALLESKIDLAIHSAKDLPAMTDEKIKLHSILPREAQADCFISKHSFADFQKLSGVKIGTCSIRRKRQLLAYNPNLIIHELRGNVNTRLAKLAALEYSAIIIAKAALNRLKLNLSEYICNSLTEDIMLPSLAQGALACSYLDSKIFELTQDLINEDNEIRFKAERAFLKELKADCSLPIAGKVQVVKDQLDFKVKIYQSNGIIQHRLQSKIGDEQNLGIALAKKVLADSRYQLLAEN